LLSDRRRKKNVPNMDLRGDQVKGEVHEEENQGDTSGEAKPAQTLKYDRRGARNAKIERREKKKGDHGVIGRVLGYLWGDQRGLS